LHEELRSGRPRSIPDEKVAALIRRTLRTKPKDGTHWSCRSLAAETRFSKSTIHRIWRAFSCLATPDSILEKIQRLCERIPGHNTRSYSH
jgi:hypothetical protein